MTPAINLLKTRRIPFTLHPYTHDPHTTRFGEEAVQALGVDGWQVFKTLVVALDKTPPLAVAVIPVAAHLDLKQLARLFNVKKATLADPALAERVTGYQTGGISPLGQKKHLPTVIDNRALEYGEIYLSGGRRGLDISLAPRDLAAVLDARFADLTSDAR